MKKEKHKFRKSKEIVNYLGDSEYHYVIEFYECEDCPATISVEQYNRLKRSKKK